MRESILGWVSTHNAELRLTVRTTVAGVLAFLLARATDLPQGYWAVFTAVIVMQSSVGGSVKATLERLVGTFGGAVYGGAVAFLLPHARLEGLLVAIVVAVAPLALLAALNTSLRIAPVTALIVLLGPVDGQASALISAVERVLEIVLGSVVGLVVSLFVLPARAHGFVTSAARRTLEAQAALLSAQVDVALEAAAAAPIPGFQAALRAALARLDTAVGEARQERRSRLTDAFDPDPLLRTLTRLRNDIIMIGRATVEPLPAVAVERLRRSLAAVSDAAAEFLRATGAALTDALAPPALDGFDAAADRFTEALAALRRDGVTRGLAADTAGRLFALSFAIEQMREDLHDLADRAAEALGAGPSPRA